MQRILKNLTSRLSELIYSLVLYNRFVKKITIFFLKQPWFVSNKVYKKLYETQIRKKIVRFKSIPLRVMVENTNFCNADCVFCPHKIMKRKVGLMTMDLFQKIVKNCVKFKIDYLTIYGFGEPFLDRFFIERIKYAKSKGIKRVTTNTNAAFMTREKVKKIIEAGLDEIYISFDAATKETYKKIRPNLDFENVTKNILSLIEEKKSRQLKKPLIYLSFVESEINCHEAGLYEKKWKGLVDGISFSSVHNWTGEVNFGHKEKSILKDPCRLLWTDMVVSWDGKVPLCCNDYENKVILGDINNQSIKEIWGGEKLKKIRKSHLTGSFHRLSICSECNYNFHYKSPWWVSK